MLQSHFLDVTKNPVKEHGLSPRFSPLHPTDTLSFSFKQKVPDKLRASPFLLFISLGYGTSAALSWMTEFRLSRQLTDLAKEYVFPTWIVKQQIPAVCRERNHSAISCKQDAFYLRKKSNREISIFLRRIYSGYFLRNQVPRLLLKFMKSRANG